MVLELLIGSTKFSYTASMDLRKLDAGLILWTGCEDEIFAKIQPQDLFCQDETIAAFGT